MHTESGEVRSDYCYTESERVVSSYYTTTHCCTVLLTLHTVCALCTYVHTFTCYVRNVQLLRAEVDKYTQ